MDCDKKCRSNEIINSKEVRRYQEALALIKKNNPLPAICGHICNRRCEDACTRGSVDQAIAIDEVKKFIAMQDLNAKTRYIPKKVIPKVDGDFSDEKIAIIGAGPAGFSCAFYLAEKGFKSVKEAIGLALSSVSGTTDVLERDTVIFPRFRRERCIGCGRCVISCADGGHQAITFNAERKPALNGKKCVGCHLCVLVCPQRAISPGQKRIKKLQKDAGLRWRI